MLANQVKQLNDKIAKCDKDLEDYDKLRHDLFEVSKRSVNSVMIPLCDIAFIPG